MFKTPLMDTSVEQTPTLFTVTECELGWRRASVNLDAPYRRVPEKQFRALVRVARNKDDAPIPHVLNIVSGTYKLVQNSELYTHIENEILRTINPDDLVGVRIKDTASHFGKTTWREYQFPALKGYVPNKGVNPEARDRSDVSFRIIVKNAYGGSALRIIYGAIDGFCTNGMIWGSFDSEYHRHSSGLTITAIAGGLTDALKQYQRQLGVLTDWANVTVTHDEVMALFKSIAASPKQYDGLFNNYLAEIEDRGKNKWAVYSTLTAYASHNGGSFKLKETDNDSEAMTMHKRELDVLKWINTKEFESMGV